MRTIDMLVFDMAGTTVNEKNVVYKTLHKAIVNFGIDVDLETVLIHGAGKEKHQAIKDVLMHLGVDAQHDSEQIFTRFKILLDEAYSHLEVEPIAGIEPILKQLRDEARIVVLNTGYSRRIATLLLEKMNWKEGREFDALITADDVTLGRPHADMIEKAMQQFEITDASTVLKAGDSAIDIQEGKNANCGLTVGVLSGAQSESEIAKAQPDHILGSLAELYTIL